jgi:hypothetical protein
MLVPSKMSTVVRITLALFATCVPILYYFRHTELGQATGFIPSFPTSSVPSSVPNKDGGDRAGENGAPAIIGEATSEKEQFIEKILGTEIDGPFNANPLAELCARTKWQEGLVMSCEATRGGGIGNIRNVFVDCVRFVIEAGGMIARVRKDRIQKLTFL